MANPLPQPGPLGNILPHRHRTFAEYYSDPELDSCQGNYQRIMARFDVDANPGVTHLILYEQAVGSSTVPQAYLCCSVVQHEVRIFCVHLPSRFVSALDGTATPWDGQGFASIGEVTNMSVTTVLFPDTVFRTAMNVRAKSTDYIIAHLAELGQRGLAPAAVDDAEASNVHTRLSCTYPHDTCLYCSTHRVTR
jgi:hypothetical protein